MSWTVIMMWYDLVWVHVMQFCVMSVVIWCVMVCDVMWFDVLCYVMCCGSGCAHLIPHYTTLHYKTPHVTIYMYSTPHHLNNLQKHLPPKQGSNLFTTLNCFPRRKQRPNSQLYCLSWSGGSPLQMYLGAQVFGKMINDTLKTLLQTTGTSYHREQISWHNTPHRWSDTRLQCGSSRRKA